MKSTRPQTHSFLPPARHESRKMLLPLPVTLKSYKEYKELSWLELTPAKDETYKYDDSYWNLYQILTF